MIQAIETYYKGYRFRSRLEARWAVFFDECGVVWEYESQGYKCSDGTCYLPDFLLHNVAGRVNGDLYVEVKGQMNDADAKKIKTFVAEGMTEDKRYTNTPILIVGDMPYGNTIDDVIECIFERAYDDHEKWPNFYNFETIDGDYFAAYPGINRRGQFEIFGDAVHYLGRMNRRATEQAYRTARQARFEHGERPVQTYQNWSDTTLLTNRRYR